MGDNENAIELQIWCALIVLVQVLHKENEANLAFHVLTAIIRLHLMNYIGITSIINKYKQKRTSIQNKHLKNPSKKKTHHHLMPELQLLY